MKNLVYISLLILFLSLGCSNNQGLSPSIGSKAADGLVDNKSEMVPVGVVAPTSTVPDRSALVGAAPTAPGVGLTDSPKAVASAMPPPSPFEGDGGSGNDLPNGILTAGSFDDALNLDIFAEYFKNSELANSGISALEQPWNTLIPQKENHTFDTLDLSFVIDVTGSMGDELSYIQSEVKGIASEIATKFPNVKQRYSLIAYRDQGDEFVTQQYDFTDDLSSFQNSIDLQNANGGGDYPEAMDQALSSSASLQWGNNNSAKILFLIADAPPHVEKIKDTFDHVFALKGQGVHIYPVAASGVLDLAESVMRTSALLTGGQYIFLTDDSGIGSSHEKPKFPCYFVEKLKDVMVRAISDELSGQRSEPDGQKLIRTVGKPVKGVCVSSQM